MAILMDPFPQDAVPRTHTDHPDGWSIDVPRGWVQIPQEPDEEGFAPFVTAPRDWSADLGFRPNLWVVLGPETSDSVAALGSAAIAASLAQTDTRVIANDLWLDEGGRRILSVYHAENALICVTHWLRKHRGRAITVTANVDADRYLRVNPLIDRAVGSLRLEEAR